MNTTDLSQFSPKWQFRFNFFRQHGAPKNPGFKQAWKALSFGDRLKINLNFFALFFGAIYLQHQLQLLPGEGGRSRQLEPV